MLTLVWVWRRFSLLLLVILQSSKMMVTRRKRSQRCLLMPVIVPRIVKRKRGLWSRLIWLHGGKGKRKRRRRRRGSHWSWNFKHQKESYNLDTNEFKKPKERFNWWIWETSLSLSQRLIFPRNPSAITVIDDLHVDDDDDFFCIF